MKLFDIELPNYIEIDNPNPARYGKWKNIKVGITIQYIPYTKDKKDNWFASYSTKGEIGRTIYARGKTIRKSIINLKKEMMIDQNNTKQTI